MALTVNQLEPNLKHFCKICNKGFGCGRALGGHMRAHGIGDESWNLDDDEDAASDWKEKYGGGSGGNELPSTKRTYALRTNPKKSCRVCEHGNCTSNEHVESSPVSPWMSEGDDDGDGERDCGGSKRKRSSRAKVGTFNSTCPPSEEEDMAAYCLMMLSNSNIGHLAITAAAAEPEESSASACRDEERRNPNFIPPISYCVPAVVEHKAKSTAVSKGLFECKACKKIFNSHQALGGHRASHKKVKGCFASRLDNLEDKDDDVITYEEFLPTKSNSIAHKDHHQNNSTLLMVSSSKRKSKVHECSICNRTFLSGQALGGHKRCHWITPNAPDSSTLARFQHFQNQMERINQIPNPSNRELPLRETENDKNEEDNNNNNYRTVSRENVEDEADSKVKKLAKLSELKDMNMGGSSSPWLQVGIGSTTGVGAEP
ncbi:hypothetical protein K1719_011150 [Acacia pycnantha]|nr:hypothetical protein K1719_011150 [Acacia pycnantha]